MTHKKNYSGSEKRIRKQKRHKQTKCFFCGKKLDFGKRTITYLEKYNGETTKENCAVVCLKCNREKSGKTEIEYRVYLKIKSILIYSYPRRNLQKLFNKLVALVIECPNSMFEFPHYPMCFEIKADSLIQAIRASSKKRGFELEHSGVDGVIPNI